MKVWKKIPIERTDWVLLGNGTFVKSDTSALIHNTNDKAKQKWIHSSSGLLPFMWKKQDEINRKHTYRNVQFLVEIIIVD